MSRVVVVARTRMHGDDVCIGGHDLDAQFRGVRLLDEYGGHSIAALPFRVGELWEIAHRPKASARPPHVEDVYVIEKRRLGAVPDLRRLVLARVKPWTGEPDAIFAGTVRGTPAGAAFIPPRGRLPACSTGYWLPSIGLSRHPSGSRIRFLWAGKGAALRFAWVGTDDPPDYIAAGSLVRVSLTRLFRSPTTPEGYYVQISGVL